jgi:hypothetical protein
MEHYERVYLIGVALHLSAFAAQAAAEGEEFHEHIHYTPLKCGLEVHLQLKDLNGTLRMRAPQNWTREVTQKVCDHVARAFFEGAYDIAPDPQRAGDLIGRGTISLPKTSR